MIDRKSFFTFHQNKNRVIIWLHGKQEYLSLRDFMSLPDKLLFNVDNCENDYMIEKDYIKVIR